MTKKNLLTFVFLLIIFGCKNNDLQKKTKIVDINIKDAFSSSVSSQLSVIALNTNYIFLETGKESMISRIGKIVFDSLSKKIIIQDKLLNHLLIFNNSGKFIAKINNIGEAPFEYKRIQGWCYFPKSKSIYILDDIQYKILKFDINGNFISYFKIPETIVGSSIFKINNNIAVFIAKPLFVLDKNCSFVLFDTTGNVVTRLFKHSSDCCKTKDAGVLNYFHKYENSLYFSESSNDTIYNISSNNIINPRYNIITNNEPIDVEITKVWSKYLGWLKHHNSISSIIETSKFLFFTGSHNMYTKNIFFDKTSNECYNVVFDLDIWDNGFYNDIDGGMPFWPSGKINDRTLYQIVEPMKLQQIISSSFYDTVTIKNINQHNKLVEFLNNSDLETNPIIVIVKLK